MMIKGAFVALLLSATAPAQSWPKKLTPSADASKYSQSKDAPFTYFSASYKIVSFKNHGAEELTDFIRCAEAVPLALKSLPLPLYDPPKDAKGVIQIVPNEELYQQVGGAKNTAGFYDGRKEKVIIHWAHFKKNTTATTLLQEPAFDLVIHELTHLAMHGLMWKAEPWFTEGVAEYLAAAHTGKGNFDFTKIDQALRARVESHREPNLIKTPVLGIETLLKLSSKDWLQRTATLTPWQTLEAYNASLLLVHYAFHGGSERRLIVKKHLETLKELSGRREPFPRLFAQTEAAKIEQAIQSYWKTRGLRLEFRPN